MAIRSILAILSLVLASSCTGVQSQDARLVRLSDVAPSILQSVPYAGSENFMGEPVRGYLSAQIMLTPAAASALASAQAEAQAEGLSLLVFDGYRPQRAVDHFVEWAANLADTRNKATYYPNVPKAELFSRGYIASRSGHSRGSTVDLTLARAGKPLDMGTRFDFFGAASHTESRAVTAEARRNRLLLRGIMERAGFSDYAREWWHYTLRNEPYPDTYFDVPIE